MSASDVVYRWDGPPRIALHRREGTRPDGRRFIAHWLETGDGTPGVVVCAIHEDKLLLVKSHRPSVGRDLWELPRGFGEAQDGSVAGSARRELAEETGLHATSASALGQYVTDSSVLPAPVGVVVCEVSTPHPIQEDDGEVDDTRWIPLSAVHAAIHAGEICDAHSLAALAYIAERWALPRR